MARPKRYETAAMRQKAYRERKRKLSADWDKATVIAHHQKPTIDALRDLISTEIEKPTGTESVKPCIFRNDYGAIITERQWNALQEKKRKAKEGGYVLDEYSQ